jgi:uncharacterized membrane protein
VVRTKRAGAIQAVDGRGLLALARRRDCLLVLRHSVGDFVPTGAGLVEVFGPAPPTLQRRVRRMFVLGRERTIEQDPAIALRILVDVAIRALSPAVNDPTTAVQVSRRLRAMLEELRSGVRPERRAAVEAELRRLEASVAASFADSGDRSLAGESDRQGIGGPARPRPG